jgi:hypothetical protein
MRRRVVAERCSFCGKPVDARELDQRGHCDTCADDLVADEHAGLYGDCDCASCSSVRGRERACEQRREAQHAGGISSFGREVLGWVHDE